MAGKKKSGFGAAFAAARAAADKGGPKTFTYQGKSFSTARADDKPSKPAKPTAKAPAISSERPKARPAALTGGTASSLAPTSSTRPRPRTSISANIKPAPLPSAAPAAPRVPVRTSEKPPSVMSTAPRLGGSDVKIAAPAAAKTTPAERRAARREASGAMNRPGNNWWRK